MTRFLISSILTKEIKSILSEKNAKVAVAFWGRESETWVTGDNIRVIANLRMGGTNPYAFKEVNADKRQCDSLHSKVYIGADRAIITSANASVNGLALEGREQDNWIEAGVLIDDINEVSQWFEKLWSEDARTISEPDWVQAQYAWDSRQKPTLISFLYFDPTAPKLPFVIGFNDSAAWDVNLDAVESSIGYSGPVAERRVDDGVWVQHENDREVLADRWVLQWAQLASGKASISRGPWFVQMSNVVAKGGFNWTDDGKPQDVLLSAEKPGLPPFDPTEMTFRTAMAATLAKSEFAALVEDEVTGQSWYAARENVNCEFWKSLKEEYLRLRSK